MPSGHRNTPIATWAHTKATLLSIREGFFASSSTWNSTVLVWCILFFQKFFFPVYLAVRPFVASRVCASPSGPFFHGSFLLSVLIERKLVPNLCMLFFFHLPCAFYSFCMLFCTYTVSWFTAPMRSSSTVMRWRRVNETSGPPFFGPFAFWRWCKKSVD